MSSTRALIWTLFLGASSAALAQDRPREEDLFGGSSAPADQAKPQGTKPQGTQDSPDRPSEQSLFGEPGAADKKPAEAPAAKTEPGGSPEDAREQEALRGGSKDAFESGEAGPEDPLKIGGLFYMRAAASAYQGQSFRETRFSAPTLVDGYFDARPNERLRGMLVARLNYDPTLGTGGTSFIPGLPTTPVPNPAVGIDQLWLRFDIERTVFVTAGKQHIRWGVGHLWAPTDYLTPQRRDPLAPFDQRLGASMLKIHIPWESQGWNFYGVGLFDSAFATAGQTTAGGSGTFDPATTNATNQAAGNTPSANLLGGIGGAARAEVVIGKTEVGVDAVFQLNRQPRFGVDLSSGIGPFDVYADVGFHQGSSSGDRTLFRFKEGFSGFSPDLPFADVVETYTPEGMVLQASGGASYTFVFNDNDTLVLGGEYFYNSLGYDDTTLYPALILGGGFQPFYTGRHYAAFTATLVAPGSWDKVTFNFSTLGNLSDRSFISRLDFFVRVLTYLQVEAYGAVHYGNAGGEFRLAFDPTLVQLGVKDVPPGGNATLHIPPPLFDVGVALRMSL